MSQIYPAQGVHPSGTATIGTTPRSSILVPMDKRLTAKIRGCSMETVPFKVVTLRRFIGGTTHLGNFQIALVRIYCKYLRIDTFPFLQRIALATFSRESLIVLQWFIPPTTMNLEQRQRSHAMMALFSQRLPRTQPPKYQRQQLRPRQQHQQPQQLQLPQQQRQQHLLLEIVVT